MLLTDPGMLPLAAAGTDPSVAIAVGLIAVLGVGSQWLAWRLKLPSILLLLVAGILFGPVARSLIPGSALALNPNELFGSDLVFALVGVSVGLILYEGGLTLRFREIRTVKRTVVSLVTLGAAVTWVAAAAAAALLFALPIQLAVLLGALLVVTGPTVIGPMLGHIRPSGASGPILKWEGIVIDPIGVLLAVLVFEAIVTGSGGEAASPVGPIARALGMTIVVGGGLGAAAALVMLRIMSRYWVPDSLQNPVSLMLVVAVYVLSNHLQQESGLLATTVMGVILANQRRADIRHILEFKESLRVLLIGALFIVLAARLSFDSLRSIDMGALVGFIVVLVVIARPAAVWVSTIGAGLSSNERMFMAMLAPRGIVAAAGSSIFALGLESNGVAGADKLVPITFGVIIGTVALYGLAAAPVARVLGIADQNPQGIVFVGAPRWVRELAKVLQTRGIRVLLVDTNRENIRAARMAEIPALNASILDEWVLDEMDLRGIGRAFAATPNEEVNTLALQRFGERFEKSGLYRLPMAPPKGARGVKTASGTPKTGVKTSTGTALPKTSPGKTVDVDSTTQLGRRAFDRRADFATIDEHLERGWVIKATNLSEEFTFKNFKTLYGPAAIPLFSLGVGGQLAIGTAERPVSPSPGETIIALVNPDELLMPNFGDMGDSSAPGQPGDSTSRPDSSA